MNSFGNDKSFMITDYEAGGSMDRSATVNEEMSDFERFRQKQVDDGCTCRWQLRNLTDIERRDNPVWFLCSLHGI